MSPTKITPLASQSAPEEEQEDVDISALRNGYVSVTPLFYDLTAHKHIEDLAWSLTKK